ncbi:MAG: N-acetylglucosamine-6-phosphate deacetylase [Chloroflexi bacterium]|nr:N-acetylglucosamine-6-phosphate deacetylase [Chloroflexota bacterium]
MTAQMQIIYGGQVWQPDRFLRNVALFVEAGQITEIRAGVSLSSLPANNLIDASNEIIIPGLIDVQVNGALGWSFQASHRTHFQEILDFHAAAGTTTLLPTLITAERELLSESLQILAGFLHKAEGINLPGIHLEGPFLAPERSGAHPPEALHLPDLALAQQFEAAANGRLKIITLAPELAGADAIIAYFAQKGVVVSAGHSAATYADMQDAIAAGLTMVTHLGNQSDWPHRAPHPLGFMGSEPGIVGALMAEPALIGSIIMDGYHVHPALLLPLLRLKGPDKILLVSDASTVVGCAPGKYESGGLQALIHAEGFAVNMRGTGGLAGSVLTLLQVVQRAVKLAHIPLQHAVHMASLGPAKLLGIAESKGQIRVGNDADLLILNQDLSLRRVINSNSTPAAPSTNR